MNQPESAQPTDQPAVSTAAPTAAPHRRRALAGLASLIVLLGTAGVVGPGVIDEVENLRQQTALTDMQTIVEGLRSYASDTLTLPTGVEGRTDVAWLHGPGELPGAVPFVSLGAERPLADALMTASMGGARWKGPYLEQLPIDPWDHAYLVSVSGLVDGRTPCMVLSAGPDGVCDTPLDAHEALGDDILLPLN